MKLEDIYHIVEESGSESAFNKGEAQAIWDILSEFSGLERKDVNVVEIGIQFGRSTTTIAEFVKRMEGWTFTAMDSWQEDVSKEAKEHVLKQLVKYNWTLNIWSCTSNDGLQHYRKKIDLIHIDGDHTYEGVMSDCKNWLPKVRIGGYVAFDDYGHDSLPGVYKAVSEYMNNNKEWKFIDRYGEKLGVFKRI